jgi:hypothetical protein
VHLTGGDALTIGSNRLYQLFKYTVYAFLAMNVYWFYVEEIAVVALQFPDGVPLASFKEAFSATIDTFAWVVLLLMFELETWILEDRHFTRPVALSLHGLRALCYVAIALMFVGYIDVAATVSDTLPLEGISDLCALPADTWSWAVMFDDYVPITAANCATLSDATTFQYFRELPVVMDATGKTEIVRLAWVDVINSGVWLLVVLVLEADVRLQEHNLYEGLALTVSKIIKIVLYSTLLLAAIYWGVKGDFVDFWDAFLWLVAFVFIELNVFEWRAEERAAQEDAESPEPL